MSSELVFLFDMDGVIVDSNPVHAQSWVEYNRRFGVETTREMIERMYGKRNDDIVREYLGAELTDAEVFAHGAAKEQLYRELMASRINEALVPGVREFLDRHNAARIGLATNGERRNIDFVLQAAGLEHYFQAVVDGQQVTRPKPFPDIYLKAAELLHASPGQCIVFEDSHAGVAAGLAAGMHVVALRTTHDEFEGAEFVMNDFRDPALEPWLGSVLNDSSMDVRRQ